MMSSTLGAPLGGTTRGGHQGLESLAVSSITPPNSGGGGGSCFPSIVVVALGEPGTPVVSWAIAGTAPTRARAVDVSSMRSVWCIVASPQELGDCQFYRRFLLAWGAES